ncbi:hypothetical protein DH2020_044399 [Rehmannia glutinosa]|uniref:C2 domain-containing protein n=1 Tax=Rehmannia glutinosa TaxID=99300 RepID=A0ABR0UH27_REHGL
MASRYEVEITIISAKDLKNVNWRHGKLRPYAVVWIDPNKKCSTRADEERDASPYWDEKLLIPFNSPIEDSILHIDVVHAKTAAEDTKPLIGSARVPLDDVGLGSTADRKIDLKRPPGGRTASSTLESASASRAIVRRIRTTRLRTVCRMRRTVALTARLRLTELRLRLVTPATGRRRRRTGRRHWALGGLAVAEGFDALENKIADDAADRVEDDLGYDGDDY